MLEIINNYYTTQSITDWWAIISSIATVGAVVAALGMHWHSEYKRDKKDKIKEVSDLVVLLKGLQSEYLGINNGLLFIFSTIDSMKNKYLTSEGTFILSATKNIEFIYTNRDYLCFYENNANKVGSIENELLRNKVVEFYVTVKMLFDRLEMHREQSNVFNRVLEMADNQGNISMREHEMQRYALKSIEYHVPQIKEVKGVLQKDYDIILKLLKEEIRQQEKILESLM